MQCTLINVVSRNSRRSSNCAGYHGTSHYVFTLNRHLAVVSVKFWLSRLSSLVHLEQQKTKVMQTKKKTKKKKRKKWWKINWQRTSLWFVYLLINESCSFVWKCRWMGSRWVCEVSERDTIRWSKCRQPVPALTPHTYHFDGPSKNGSKNGSNWEVIEVSVQLHQMLLLLLVLFSTKRQVTIK